MNARQHLREQTVKALAALVEEDPEVIRADFARLDEENKLVHSLLDARHAAGFTQRDLAKASGLSAAKICRMESGCDADLNMGDVQAYLAGLGTTLRISFPRPRRKAARRPAPSRRARLEQFT